MDDNQAIRLKQLEMLELEKELGELKRAADKLADQQGTDRHLFYHKVAPDFVDELIAMTKH